MRRGILILLVLALICGAGVAEESACVESREENIIWQGEQLKITTVRFVGESGYSFWYDPEVIQPIEAANGEGDLFAGEGYDGALQTLQIRFEAQNDYNLEALGAAVLKQLEREYGDTGYLKDFNSMKPPYRLYFGMDEECTQMVFVVDGGTGVYYIKYCYENAMAAAFGNRVRQMLASFELTE